MKIKTQVEIEIPDSEILSTIIDQMFLSNRTGDDGWVCWSKKEDYVAYLYNAAKEKRKISTRVVMNEFVND